MPKNYNLFLKGDVGGWNFSSDMVNWILDKNKDSEVHVLVNSLGGYTHEGLSISSLFKIHGNVHVHFIGANASAATIAAMGAARITIDSDACFLVHKCLGFVFEWDWLNSDQLDQHIKELEKKKANQEVLDSCVAGMYARRCKKSKDELLKLMEKDTWLTPEQALEWGFVDEITDNPDDKVAAPSQSAVASLVSSGVPAPPVSASGKKGSMFSRFLAFLNSFSNQASESDTDDATISSQPMPAKTTALAALLGVSLSMSAENTLQLSADQATKVDDHIDALNASVAEKDSTISALRAEIASLKESSAEKDRTIAELRREPAASTTDVTDDSKGDEDPYAPVSESEALEVSRAFCEL